MNYVLITFYNRGTTVKPLWEVYGHVSEIENHHLETFKTRTSAIEYAHAFCAPVLQTSSGNHIARRLA
jgi:hypothetical protein